MKRRLLLSLEQVFWTGLLGVVFVGAVYYSPAKDSFVNLGLLVLAMFFFGFDGFENMMPRYKGDGDDNTARGLKCLGAIVTLLLLGRAYGATAGTRSNEMFYAFFAVATLLVMIAAPRAYQVEESKRYVPVPVLKLFYLTPIIGLLLGYVGFLAEAKAGLVFGAPMAGFVVQ